MTKEQKEETASLLKSAEFHLEDAHDKWSEGKLEISLMRTQLCLAQVLKILKDLAETEERIEELEEELLYAKLGEDI